MSFYNTGNPVPSLDPRDLDDNAKHLDEFVNGTEPTYTDRLGVERKTLSAIESDADSELLRTDLSITSNPSKGMALVPSGLRTLSILTDAMSMTGWQVGQRFNTLGRLSLGDDGANHYVVVDGGTGTSDGGSFINHPDGVQFKGLFVDGCVRAEQWGILRDWLPGLGGTDNSPAIKAFLAYMGLNKRYKGSISQMSGKLCVGSYMNIPSGVSVKFNEIDIVPLNDFSASNGYMFGMASANASTEDAGAVRSRRTEIEGLRLYNDMDLVVKGIFTAATKTKISNVFSLKMHQTIARSTEYIDMVTIDTVNISEPRGTDYHIDMPSSGDGLHITNSHLYNYTPGVSNLNHINVRLSAGAKIDRIINGNINLARTMAVSLENSHIEAGNILIENSICSIRNTYIWNNLLHGTGYIEVTNTVNNQKNIINLEAVTFIYNNQQAYNGDYFDVKLPAASGTLNIKGCCRAFVDINATGNRVLSGIRISQGGVQFDRFNRWSHVLSNSCQIQQDVSTPFTVRQLGTGDALTAAASTAVVPWRAATATYYYRALVLLDATRRLGKVDATEYSRAANLNGSGTRLQLNYAETVGMIVRIYRGTTANSYDQVVDVPIIDAGEGLKDDGVSINGFSFSARTAGPAQAVDACSGITIEGLLATLGVAATPSAGGTFTDGDRAVRRPPVVGQFKALSRASGAWVSEGNL